MITEYACAAVRPSASVAVTVKLNVPAAEGGPVIAPVEVFNANPPGRAPAVTAKLTGARPPLGAIVWLYAVDTVPLGSERGVIADGLLMMPAYGCEAGADPLLGTRS